MREAFLLRVLNYMFHSDRRYGADYHSRIMLYENASASRRQGTPPKNIIRLQYNFWASSR